MPEELIQCVQSLVKPADAFPTPFISNDESHPDWGIWGEPSTPNPKYRRPQPPTWVLDSAPRNEPPIGPDDELAIDDESAEPGVDISKEVAALPKILNPDEYAFYLPFHFYHSRWGVYVKASGILAITGLLLNTGRITSRHSALLNAVYRVLLEHEAFHHFVELAISRLETPPVLLPGGSFLYREYFPDPSAGLHEEALANAHALRALSKQLEKGAMPLATARGIESLIAKLMQMQPAGYRDFAEWITDSAFRGGKDLLVHAARALGLSGVTRAPKGLVAGRQYFLDRRLGSCPIYLVRDVALPALKVTRPFSKKFGMLVKVHTNDHLPPHFHLETPVGQEIGRYEWPSLNPYLGAPPLSRAQLRDLRRYIESHQPKIFQKIRTIYPGVSNLETPR